MKPATLALLKAWSIVAAGTVLAVAGALWNAKIAAQARSLDRLAASGGIERDAQEQALEVLQLRAQALADDPAFVDYVTQSQVPDPKLGGAVDNLSVSDLLKTRRHGDDVALLLDAEGAQITAIGSVGKERQSIQHDPLVIESITQLKPVQGVWLDGDGMFWVAIHPMLRGRTPQGYVILAEPVTDAFFAKLSRLAHSDVVLVADGGKGASVRYASGLDIRFNELLAAHRDALFAVADSAGGMVAMRDGARDIHVWAMPVSSNQRHAALVALDQRADLGEGRDAATWRLVSGILGFGVLAALCVLLAWRSTWQPLGQLVHAFDTDKAAIAKVRGGALMRDVRDRMLLLLKAMR
ncbi:MAG TPA: hypothetical protein VIM98_09810 [Dyella sp.]|uniref:hypothetical protein n=1 Tax=Dyella sp. TaxID=1869338 RepID=UPI002F94000A